MTIRYLHVVLLILAGISFGMSQEVFHSFRTTNFEIKHQAGIPEAEARKVSDYLQQDYGYLRQVLGLDFQASAEIRLYDTDQKFAKATGERNASKGAVFKRGIVHVKPVAKLVTEKRLEEVLSYCLAVALLDQTVARGCPQWLAQSFAVYHCGRMANLSPPTGRKVRYFSDLDQDIQEFPDPPKRDEVEFLLGTTMKSFVEEYGETKSFQVFMKFDGATQLEDVIKSSFGVEFSVVEQTWAKAIAAAVGDLPSGTVRKK